MLVNLCSYWDGCDSTCLLEASDHEFVRHLSYVDYARSRIEHMVKLAKGVQDGIFVPRELMADVHFDRICEGVEKSPYVPIKVLKYYRERQGAA